MRPSSNVINEGKDKRRVQQALGKRSVGDSWPSNYPQLIILLLTHSPQSEKGSLAESEGDDVRFPCET